MTHELKEDNVKQDSAEMELLRLAKRGDYAAFQQLVVQLQPRVYGLVLRILRQPHDAEDATQQTFVSLIEHLQDFREESSIVTWILKVATNAALKILRKKRGHTAAFVSSFATEEQYRDLTLPEFIAPWSKTAEEIAEQAEVREELDRALESLEDRYRLVFILRDIEGLSVKETAETLQLSESNVKVRLLRARLALREKLTKKFGDPRRAMQPIHVVH